MATQSKRTANGGLRFQLLAACLLACSGVNFATFPEDLGRDPPPIPESPSLLLASCGRQTIVSANKSTAFFLPQFIQTSAVLKLIYQCPKKCATLFHPKIFAFIRAETIVVTVFTHIFENYLNAYLYINCVAY